MENTAQFHTTEKAIKSGLHMDNKRRIVSYDFGDNGQFTRGEEQYSFSSSSSSSTECGKTSSNVQVL